MEAQLASYLVNGAFISAAGAACVYIAFASCFPKRNPTWVFWAYFFCKGCAMAYFDATRVLLPSVPVAAYALATVAIGVATYAVLYFTWKTEVLKIGIVGIAADLIGACALLLAILVSNTALGLAPTLSYTGASCRTSYLQRA